MHSWIRNAVVPSLLGLGLLTSPGCGPSDGLPPRLPVSGTVTYNGQPVAMGNIGFVPEDEAVGKPASGIIQDGKYSEVTTLTPGDGVIPGKYKVIISSTQADLSQAEASAAGGVMDQVAVGKAYAKAKSSVPEKYADFTQSGLTADVQKGQTTFDFQLTD